MEGEMAFKHKKYTPQEMIQIGMLFFLVGLFVNLMGDERLVGRLLADVISDLAILNFIRGAAAGFSIPFFGVSIYFNVRGLIYLRSQGRC
jgi:hypothetical protein